MYLLCTLWISPDFHDTGPFYQSQKVTHVKNKKKIAEL